MSLFWNLVGAGALGRIMRPSDPQSAGEMTQESIQAMTEHFPEYLKMLRKEGPLQAEAEVQLQDEFAKRKAASDFRIADRFIPQYNQLGRDEDYANRMSDAATGVDVLRGPGGAMVDEAFSQAQRVDPEFYARRAQTSRGLGDLLRSFAADGTVTDDNPYGTFTGNLSGGEREEIERALNRRGAQTGNLSTPSATNVVANAMQFGNAMQNRRNAFGQALQQATSFLPASRSGFDPMQVAIGRPSTHFGAQQFSQPQISNQNVMNQGSNMLNLAGRNAQVAAGLQANKQSWGETLGQVKDLFPGMFNQGW